MTTRLPPEALEGVVVNVTGVHSEVVWLDDQQRQRFLTLVAQGMSFVSASNEIGVPYMAIGRELVINEQFATDLEAAKELRKLALEEIAIEQSTVGVDEPLTYQGEVMTHEITGEPVTVKKLVTGNSLLLALLKANSPDKFGDKLTVNPGSKDVPSKITKNAERDKLLALLERREAIAARKPDNEDLI